MGFTERLLSSSCSKSSCWSAMIELIISNSQCLLAETLKLLFVCWVNCAFELKRGNLLIERDGKGIFFLFSLCWRRENRVTFFSCLKVREGKGGGSDQFTHQILPWEESFNSPFPLLVSGDSREESICCGILFTDISFAFLSFAKFNN